MIPSQEENFILEADLSKFKYFDFGKKPLSHKGE